MSLNIDEDGRVFTQPGAQHWEKKHLNSFADNFELIDNSPLMKGHLDINDASAVMDMNYSGAESECGCVLTGSTQS